jgi:hypothetical protein
VSKDAAPARAKVIEEWSNPLPLPTVNVAAMDMREETERKHKDKKTIFIREEPPYSSKGFFIVWNMGRNAIRNC